MYDELTYRYPEIEDDEPLGYGVLWWTAIALVWVATLVLLAVTK
jgi:hypothetical protein